MAQAHWIWRGVDRRLRSPTQSERTNIMLPSKVHEDRRLFKRRHVRSDGGLRQLAGFPSHDLSWRVEPVG